MSTWTFDLKHPIDYLLLEAASSYLLQENGDQVILEQTGNATSLWSFTTKH